MQAKRMFDHLSPDQARKLVDRRDILSPFSKFIGNMNAVEQLSSIAYAGLMNEYRECPDINIAIYGQHSTGKTTLIKLFSQILDLPLLTVQATEITNIDYLVKKIDKTLEDEMLWLTPVRISNEIEYYEIPPMVIFIDEIHGLPSIISDGLLSTLERKTTCLSLASSEFDFRQAWWFIATTERGRIPLPFGSRFLSIDLFPYSMEEIAQIVQLNTDWPKDDCLYISSFARIPRSAIDFAHQVRFTAQRFNTSIVNAIDYLAKMKGIDQNGIDQKQYNVMIALAKSLETGRSLKSLCDAVGVNKEEMEVHILPLLLIDTVDRKALVRVSNRHHITETGISLLRSKGII